MTRRSWLTSALALVAGGVAAPTVLTACGSPDTRQAGHASAVELVGSTRTRAAAEANALGPAVTAVQDFGAAAFRTLATRQAGNLVMSPLSVHLALGMTALGARGGTATEMRSALHAPDATTLARGLNALTAELATRAGKIDLPGGTPATIELRIADALWGQRGLSWAPAFLDALATDFGAGMRVADFTTQAEQARRAINGWVGEVTHNTIPELIQQGALPTSTRLALVNALYLKAPWAVPFRPDATTDGGFTRADGTSVKAPFMHQTTPLAYGTGTGWQAVRLPYVDQRLAMTLILPDAGRAAEVVASLDGARLRTILQTPREASVQLALPRWRTRTSLSLNDLLARLGMATAFTSAADFTGMTTTKERLTLDAVLHQGYLAVDEQGTEASAATVAMMAASGLTDSRTVTFDRPFLYVLHDSKTKAPLFLGQVADPLAG